MPEIQMTKRWTLGAKLGAGGFGAVFMATSEDGETSVIKLVPKAPGADREVLFENLAGTPNIMPVTETSETATDLVLRMPQADMSLADYLAQNSPLGSSEAVIVLRDVATALAHLDGRVVHRDIKPGNVLRYKGQWCLADFGLARYVADATDQNTRKFAWTAPYAAPEQWRHERAVGATDIYSFGVMAFEILSGSRPFQGPDFRDQHLHTVAPQLTQASAPLQSLVSDCLLKAPGARPRTTNVLTRLNQALSTPSPAMNKLQAANAAVALQQASVAAAVSADRSEFERRAELFAVANEQLSRIIGELRDHIKDQAPSTAFGTTGLLKVTLGQGTLVVDSIKTADIEIDKVTTKFDVIAYSSITVKQPRSFYGYEGRQHSLWFAAMKHQDEYRWRELAFMDHALIMTASPSINPFAMQPERTHSSRGHVVQPARKTRFIDQGEELEFFERWLSWLANAAGGNLGGPRNLPED
jgi:eukaryotic-like serine/threonine-protein kinase